jgi:hypothetical protein
MNSRVHLAAAVVVWAAATALARSFREVGMTSA